MRAAKLNFKITRSHSEVGVVKQIRVEVARLSRDVEKMTASLTDAANSRVEAVKKADILFAQRNFSVPQEDAYKSELTAVKAD